MEGTEMRYSNALAVAAVAAGLAFAGGTAKAEEHYREGRDIEHERRDLDRDYAKVHHLRADIERDRWRMDQDLRSGRERAAARKARDIARDERALESQLQDIRRDKADLRRERRDWDRDYWRDR
jgi:hypothetical protein